MTTHKLYDGSRCHILDWVETPTFVETVNSWVGGHGMTVADRSTWMPKSWADPKESRLFDPRSPFLPEHHKAAFKTWWLVHADKANIPNWDLIIMAAADGLPALVLVEAKAYVGEFDCNPKPCSKRDTPDAQRRTDDNHERIGLAIAEASQAMAKANPGISISRDRCYQLSNRIATGWKLATLGIPTVLIFVGFTGDAEIALPGRFFADDGRPKPARA